MTIHFFVEGASEEAFLESWFPRAFPGRSFRVHPHQGKGALPRGGRPRDPRHRGLLDVLPATLRAFKDDDESTVLVVLVDADEEDCVELKSELNDLVAEIEPRPRVLLRIAVEETEAFYLGDQDAISRAYPNADLKKVRAWKPDSICGTAELFDEIIGGAGALNKRRWALKMGAVVTTRAERSRSPSFRAFCSGLGKVLAPTPTKRPAQKKHWKSRFSAIRRSK